jgi:hypothetical protein
MGGKSSTNGRNEKMHTKFWSENLKGIEHSEDIEVEGRIILEWIIGK